MQNNIKDIYKLLEQIEAMGIIGAIGDGVSIQGTDFKILFQNQVHKDFFGDHVGDNCYKAYRQKDNVCEECPVSGSLEDNFTHKSERSIITDKGTRHFEITVSPLRDSSGKIISGIEIAREITESKKTEKLLMAEREQMVSIFDSIDEAVYVSDPETYEVLFANLALKKVFGEVTGEKCFKAFQNMEAPCPFCTNDRIFGNNAGRPYIWEFQNCINHRWYRCIDKAIRWTDGRMVRCEMAVDITEYKRVDEKTRENERFLDDIFSSIQDGISILDKDMNIVRVNRTMENWYSHVMPLAGKKCYEAYHFRRQPCEICPTRKTLETKQAHYDVVPKRGPVGEVIGWLDLYSFPIFEKETGELKGVIEYVRDITERRKVEHELKERIEELERFYDMAIGRELKMKELKDEAHRLRLELSKYQKD
ncbi:MAG: PAS domain-containing protein [Nitrospirae bacterium]|nr:PAS domain-containing protein [Nitrospirota bacterium]